MTKLINMTCLCSDNPGRAYSLEWSFGEVEAHPGMPEKLPPSFPLDWKKLGRENKKIFLFKGFFRYPREWCPFCEKAWFFFCTLCNIFSCTGRLRGRHVCPGCERIFVIFKGNSHFLCNEEFRYVDFSSIKEAWGPSQGALEQEFERSRRERFEQKKQEVFSELYGTNRTGWPVERRPAEIPPPSAFGEISQAKTVGRRKLQKFLKEKKKED